MKHKTLINANFVRSGSGSLTARVNLPITILKHMEITESDRGLIFDYDMDKKEIILKKFTPLDEFSFEFEYKYIEKINDCFDNIMVDYFDQKGLTGSRWTFSRAIGGKEIAGVRYEREDYLKFDEQNVIEIFLQKRELTLKISANFFKNPKFTKYREDIKKLKIKLANLAKEDNIKFNLV